MDASACKEFVNKAWKETVIPTLCEYIKVPNLSPVFDANILTNGHQEKAMQLIVDWVASQNVPGLTMDMVVLPGRTPLLFIEVTPIFPEGGTIEDVGTVLLYGHMDKQPPFEGWNEDLDPYKPVLKDGKLYGRGGADDGYSCFSAITAIQVLKEQKLPHARCVIIIEGCEESGSPDLPYYMEHLKERIGAPNLVVCLDSGCGNYDQLWVTDSLRGVVVGELTVSVISEGVHSGDASGIVPDTFRIARKLLSRLEDETTGKILPPGLSVEITEKRMEMVTAAANVLGQEGMVDLFPFIDDAKPVEESSLGELALNRWWRSQLAVTGAAGLPAPCDAGNVLRPTTKLVLSLRLPPTLPTVEAEAVLKELFEKNPPYNAKVEWKCQKSGGGWAAPPLAPWLETAAKNASNSFFQKPAIYQGEGGSIPFMGMLGRMFPKAQFLIIGVLGPASNAHGPNEFLHIEFSERLTCCVASVLAHHCNTKVEKLLREGSGAGDGDIEIPDAAQLTSDYGRDKGGCKI